MTPKTYTITQAANWLGLPRWKMYALVKRGEIPSFKEGRIFRVREKDLRRWWERQPVASDVWWYPQL